MAWSYNGIYEKRKRLKLMAAMTFKVSGARKIANNILIAKNVILGRIAVAVEKTAVAVSNHAKANHVQGQAHGQGRFEVDTGVLVKSITPELETVNFKEVTAVVFTNVEYAIPVEFGTFQTRPYPFLFPALIANQRKLLEMVARAKV